MLSASSELPGAIRAGSRQGRAGATWASPQRCALLLRVAPPRPRNVTPVSVRIRWTKPYDLPVEAASDRMLSPESYLLPRVVASLLRSTPVTRVPFLRVSTTCTSRLLQSPLSYASLLVNDQA